MSHSPAPIPADAEIPRGNSAGLFQYLGKDLLSGFLVFLIALPLCLGIATASNFPPLAGILTAIVGGIVTTLISNSELTIKGPAAGLIVITVGCIQDFGFALEGDPVANLAAYRAALAVGAVAGLIQISFAIFRFGILQEFFPSSVVHGMLAAIGITIIAKQVHVLLGVKPPAAEPLHLLAEIPHSLAHLHPHTALIGGLSLLLLVLWPRFRPQALNRLPAQLLVIVLGVTLANWFQLPSDPNFLLGGPQYGLQPADGGAPRVTDLLRALTTPDFSALWQWKAWFWIALYALIGSLESLLSAKATDLIDPWKRKTDFNRDLLAVGVANTIVSLIGGLPMISEIVRSRANLDNGARTRFANLWHGVFLLLAILLIPQYLHRIPLSALAAMLVFTGYRLASPREFLHVYHIGSEQLLIFVATLVGVLATDLLIGVCIGIGMKTIVHVINGVSPSQFFKPFIDLEEQGPDQVIVRAAGSAVFSNWIPFRNQLVSIGFTQRKNITVDFTNARLVDCSVLEKLQQLQGDFEAEGLKLEVVGLETMQQFSAHEFATRRAGLTRLRRLTVIAPPDWEAKLQQAFLERGATGFTAVVCRGVGRRVIEEGDSEPIAMTRMEVIAPEAVCRAILIYLEGEVRPQCPVTACVETVEVLRTGDFEALTKVPFN
jgi:MFS superfamily sulfate permease-like transporter